MAWLGWLAKRTRPIYTEKRLSRNLDDETLEASVAEAVLKDAAYAIADGIKRAFTRFGRWLRTTAKTIAEMPETDTAQRFPSS